MRLRLLPALCVAAALATPGVAYAQAKCKLLKIVDWPVTFVRGHIVVEGAINGKKIGIILDTGAQMSMILRSSAVRLDLPRREALGWRFYGVGGETKVEIATVDDFKLGAVSSKDMQLYVAGENDFGEGSDVLLGEDFLQKFDVEFDLPAKTVRLFQPKDCDGVSLAYWTKEVAGEVEIERIDESRPRIHLTVHINGKPIEAFLDSGASTSVLSKEDAASVGVTPETQGVVSNRYSGGLGAKLVENWSGPFQSFAIGNESIPDVRIRFAELFKDAKFAETGSRVARKVFERQPMLLGADFLRSHRTFVSHSQRRLYFTYAGGPVFVADPAPKPAPSAGREPGAKTDN